MRARWRRAAGGGGAIVRARCNTSHLLALPPRRLRADSQGVVHRDIKPENILLQPYQVAGGEKKYVVKVTDFGMAAMGDAMGGGGAASPRPGSDGGSAGSGSAATGAGAAPAVRRMHSSVGTYLYLAPEAVARSSAKEPLAAIANKCERVLAAAAAAQGMRGWHARSAPLAGAGSASAAGAAAPAAQLPRGFHYRPGADDYAELETSRRHGYTPAVDSWSLGVVLFMVLGAAMPFYEGDGRPSLLTQQLLGQLDFEGKNWLTVSKEARALILALLHPNPSRRLTPAQALAHEWLAAPPAGSPSAAAPAPAPAPALTSTAKRRAAR